MTTMNRKRRAVHQIHEQETQSSASHTLLAQRALTGLQQLWAKAANNRKCMRYNGPMQVGRRILTNQGAMHKG